MDKKEIKCKLKIIQAKVDYMILAVNKDRNDFIDADIEELEQDISELKKELENA